MYETIRVGEMSVTFLKTRHETGGVFDLFELIMPSFPSRPASPHPSQIRRDHLRRRWLMTWTLDGKPTEVRRGVTLFIPRGTPHSYANHTHTPGRVLCLQTPGVMGPEYYLEIAALYLKNRHPDLAGIGAIMSRYGVVPVHQKEDLIPLIQPER